MLLRISPFFSNFYASTFMQKNNNYFSSDGECSKNYIYVASFPYCRNRLLLYYFIFRNHFNNLFNHLVTRVKYTLFSKLIRLLKILQGPNFIIPLTISNFVFTSRPRILGFSPYILFSRIQILIHILRKEQKLYSLISKCS